MTGEREARSVVAIESVTLSRPGFTLGPASLQLRAAPENGSSLTVLVGPSGSGKSTLLALAAGLLPPTAGVVRHDGVDLRTLREAARSSTRRATVAFAAQQPLFFAEQSILQNLAWTARRRSTRMTADLSRRGCETLARSSLAAVGLEALVHRSPALLSGGEQARANVARALCGEADAVLLDEPTAMLDSVSAARIRALLVQTASLRPLLIATHDDELIAQATTVLRLDDGRVIE